MAQSGPDYQGTHADADLYEQLADRPTVPIPVPSPGASGALLTKPCIVVGWSFRETAGGAANVQLYSGGGTGGLLVASVGLVANASDHEAMTADGPLAAGGLYLNKGAGSIEGCVWVKW